MLREMVVGAAANRSDLFRTRYVVGGSNAGSPLIYTAGADPAFSAAAPMMLLQNPAVAGAAMVSSPNQVAGLNAQPIGATQAQVVLVPLWIRLTVTTAPVGMTSLAFQMQLDNIQRWTSGGIQAGAANTFKATTFLDNTGTTFAPRQIIGDLRMQAATIITASAASAAAYTYDPIRVKTAAAPCLVVGDTITIVFGAPEAAGGGLIAQDPTTVPGTYTVFAPMIEIGRGCTLAVLLGIPGTTTGPTFDTSMAWLEPQL